VTKMEIISAALANFGISSLIIGGLGYKLWRVLKADGTSDVLNKSAIELIEVHKSNAVAALAYSSELKTRLSEVEHERNEMSEQFGKIRSDYEHVSAQLVKVSASCFELRQENKEQSTKLAEQSKMIQEQKAMIAEQGAMISGLEDMVRVLMKMQDKFLDELRGIK